PYRILYYFLLLLLRPPPSSTLFPYTTLFRSYRLHGFVASLIVLAGLFIWKNSLVFIPTFESREDDVIAGKEAFAGFVNLLRRNRSEEHTSELQSPDHIVCRLLLEKKKQSTDD